MGNLNSMSTSEESREDDPKGKAVKTSLFRIKVRGPKEGEPEVKRKPKGKRRWKTLTISRSSDEEEMGKSEEEDVPPPPKKARTTRTAKKKGQGASGDEPPIVDVESSGGEKAKVYTRRSRTPSPKDTMQKKDSPLRPPVVEPPKAVSPPPSIPEPEILGKQETSGEAEPFKEGTLFSEATELEVEEEERHTFPLVQYEDSLESDKGRRSSEPEENIPAKVPAPVHPEVELEEPSQGEKFPEEEEDRVIVEGAKEEEKATEQSEEGKTEEIRVEPAAPKWLERELARKKQVIVEDTPLD